MKETFLERKELTVFGVIDDELEMILDHSPNWVGNIFTSTYLAMEHYLTL